MKTQAQKIAERRKLLGAGAKALTDAQLLAKSAFKGDGIQVTKAGGPVAFAKRRVNVGSPMSRQADDMVLTAKLAKSRMLLDQLGSALRK